MKNKTRKFISGALSVTFALSLSVSSGFKQVQAAQNNLLSTKDIKAEFAKRLNRTFSQNDNKELLKSKYGQDYVINENKPLNTNPNEKIRVVVQLKDKPTSEAKTNNLNAIKTAQASVKQKVQALGDVEIRHTYTDLVNGFSMTIKRSDIDKVKAVPGVKSVTEAVKYYPDMTSAKSLTQAYDAWENAKYKVKGEGMVVSIIDTGIDWTHKDMRLSEDNTSEKITSKTPDGPGKYFSSKVPYGYNFAEMNQNVIPSTASDSDMHGMHVAGIVGANGTQAEVDKNEAIQGVAPECQLLAMKVFANDPNIGGAYTDDIIAAIEDSVKHGADVINMSLGSNAGFQDADQPEQEAIKNATDKGVEVVVSAGNSQYNTAPYKWEGMYDTGVVGSPGLAKDTLQVASYENKNIMLYTLDYTSTSGNGSLTYEINNMNPYEVLKGDSEIVDCGLGQVADFKDKDVNGKIALVSRGNIAFAEKEVNAQNAGAKAIIIYNNRAGYIGGMVVDPTVNIPVIGMLQADGTALSKLIGSGLKIEFNGKLTSVTNINKDAMSDFTSWGPTPSLDFKPEISAPGGNIWSTLNDNKYGNMSGTSMAAPHTSGAEALILEALKKANPSLSGRDLVELAKTTSINTAKTVMDKDHSTVPYSPRRQGAGLVQINDAINNLVTVTDNNGNAAVALKEIGKTKTFTLNLKNYDSDPATYTLGNIGGVLTEQKESTASMSYDVKIDGAAISFNNNTVTVPANGTATVNVTVTLPDSFDSQQFVEGYVKFTSADKPSLVVPYIGFYGDWSKQDTIDKPVWDEKTNYGYTQLVSVGPDGSSLDNLGNTELDPDKAPKIDKDKIAISPNGDGFRDNAYPLLTFLRNAKTMNIQLLNKDNQVISQIATDSNIRRNVFAATGDRGFMNSMNWMWDGKIFDSKTGASEVAPDGQYYLDYVTKVDLPTAKEQHLTMPVKVDTTAPEIEVTSPTSSKSTNYNLTWKVTDNLSGDVGASLVLLNGIIQENLEVTNTNGVYSCNLQLENDKVNNIVILGADNALNITAKEITVAQNSGAFKIYFDNLSSRITVNTSDLNVTGSVSYIPSELKIGGQDVTIDKDNLTFSVDLKLTEGRNIVPIYALDIDGRTVLQDFAYKVDCDTVAPELTLDSPVTAIDGKVYTNNNKITIAGKVSDNTNGYKLYINGDQKMSIELDGASGKAATERSFSYEVPVTDNSNVEVKVVDLFGNETVKNINVMVGKKAPVVQAQRLAGKDRVDTSLAIAKEQYSKNKPDAVVLATANDFPDALAGSGLAYKYNAPILLVNKTVKDSKAVLDYITTNLDKNKNIYVLGGNGAVTTEISDYLSDNGYTVIRLAGKDRYETNKKIIDYLNPEKGTPLVITTGNDFADALSSSSVVAMKGYSLLLNGKDSISNDVKSYISNVKPTTVYLVGGTGVLSSNIEAQIKALNSEINIVRLAGKDRYETSMLVTEQFNGNANTIAVATGEDFPDALSGSVLAARKNSCVLLIDNKDVTKQKALIGKNKIMNVLVFGGEGVISKDITNSLIN